MFNQLQKQIKNNDIAPIYIFSGEEDYLLNTTVNLLVEVIAPNGEDTFNLEKFDGNVSNLKEIVNSANSLPFFATKKLILVENAHWFSNSKKKVEGNPEELSEEANADEYTQGIDTYNDLEGLEDMIKYFANPLDTTCLVFLPSSKVSKTKKITKAAIKNMQNCLLVDFQAIKGEKAMLWLDGLLKAEGKKMPRDAMQQLLLGCDYKCALVVQELKKVFCYVGDKVEITKEDLSIIASNNITTTIFNLIDNVSVGNLGKSLEILEQILLLESPFMIIPILSNHFQLMIISKVMKGNGHNIKEIMAATGKGYAFMIEKAINQGRGYNDDELRKILNILLQGDKKLKTGVCSPIDALETAIIQICFLKAQKSK